MPLPRWGPVCQRQRDQLQSDAAGLFDGRREAGGGLPQREDGAGDDDAATEARVFSAAADQLLYINYQPHYAAGFIDFQAEGAPVSASVQCCVLLEDHWAGPHLEPRLYPSVGAAVHAPAIDAAFGAAREAMALLGAEQTMPHWFGQVRYRRCAIYFAILALGSAYACVSAAQLILPHRADGGWRRTRAV